MLKKLSIIFMALVISACSLTACTSGESSNNDSADNVAVYSSTESTASVVSAASSQSEESGTEFFAEGDTRDVENETANATITLSGNEGTLSDTTRGSSGSDVTITSKGIYEITGSSENVSIIVNDDGKSGNIYLVLNNAQMTNSEKPCIIVENSEKVIIVSKNGTQNSLKYTCTSNSDGLDAAIYSADDVTFGGSGELSVDSSLHGVVCKDDLKVVGSILTVNASSAGFKAGDSVRIGGGTLNITSQHDGIQAQNKDGTSFMYMNGGTVTISAGYDGIDVGSSNEEFTGSIKLLGGSLNITSGGGSDNSKDSETSQKGIKCDGNIYIADSAVTVSGADDAVNSKATVEITSGVIALSTSDDGISATNDIKILDGELSIDKSYEALEAANVTISGGNISVTSSDDGINADGFESEDLSEVTLGNINISGGNVYVNSSGDGIDSNGSINVTGGTIIIEAAEDSGNGAIDIGDGSGCTASITGGTVIALGSVGMAKNFDSGSQCSALINISGEAKSAISVDDGSDFTFTTSKSFGCAVYSSPKLKEGSTYTITAGSEKAEFDFGSGLYFNNVN